jgi:hypothetical protein
LPPISQLASDTQPNRSRHLDQSAAAGPKYYTNSRVYTPTHSVYDARLLLPFEAHARQEVCARRFPFGQFVIPALAVVANGRSGHEDEWRLGRFGDRLGE